MADWSACQNHLYWSANHEKSTWQRHGDALQKKNDSEPMGYALMRAIQKHNEAAQKTYDECHTANLQRFWDIAVEVYDENGPQG